jgi:2-polyprenyl-3-methyl-5-hydroxy-6-metoxy-1,4-benzoquinol methylase
VIGKGSNGASYDAWHAQRAPDSGRGTPWHDLVATHLVWSTMVTGKRVLEVGCGRGGFSRWLASQPGPPTTHVAADYSATALAIARAAAVASAAARVRWEQQDIQALTFPSASFDTVISCETVEHVERPAEAIAELGRVLAPGGVLLLTTPNYLSALGLYRLYRKLSGRTYGEEGQPINRWVFLPLTLSWIARSGLRVVAVDGVGHYAYLPGAPPRRIASLDRLRWLTRWSAVHSLVVATKSLA